MTARVVATADFLKSAPNSRRILALEVMLRDRVILDHTKKKSMVRKPYDDLNELMMFKEMGVDQPNKVKFVAVLSVNEDATTRMPLYTEDSFKQFILSSNSRGHDVVDFRATPKHIRDKYFQVVKTSLKEMLADYEL